MKIDVKELTKISLEEDEVLLIQLEEDIETRVYDMAKKDIEWAFKQAGLRNPNIILSTLPIKKLTKIKEKKHE